jgi:hypothetical protein
LESPSLIVIDGVAADAEMPEQIQNLLNPVLCRRKDKFTIITTEVHPLQWTHLFGKEATEELQTKSRIVDLTSNRGSFGVWNQRINASAASDPLAIS